MSFIAVQLIQRCASCAQLIDGAEAKAFYGLALNYAPLQALVERLLVKETLSGTEVTEVLEGAGVIPFPDPYVEGFQWSPEGGLVYPGMPTQASSLLQYLLCLCILHSIWHGLVHEHELHTLIQSRPLHGCCCWGQEGSQHCPWHSHTDMDLIVCAISSL